MMFRLREIEELCVIRVSPKVLDLDGVWYSTRNAASDEAEFHQCVGDFDHLDYHSIFVKAWNDGDSMQRMQAEILVPGGVPPEFLECVYVKSENSRAKVRAAAGDLDVRLYPGLFFLT